MIPSTVDYVRPATVDGKPEQAWASMRYTWRLE